MPQTLLKLDKTHEIAVIEIGTNEKGEIRRLTNIADPDVAVLTNVGESHLEGLGSKSGVFNEKYDLVKYMKKNGTVIFNKDDEYLSNLDKKKLPQEKISYSIKQESNYQAKGISFKKNQKTAFRVNRNPFIVKMLGEHSVYNALASISCGRYFKISYNNISTILSKFEPVDGRGQIEKLRRIWLINDSYNSNPLSFKSALDSLSLIKAQGKKIVVCADMLELGSKAHDLHQIAAQHIEDSNVDFCLTFGKYSKLITKKISADESKVNAQHFDSIEEIKKKLKSICSKGDVVLVKGSRAMAMDKISDYLKKAF